MPGLAPWMEMRRPGPWCALLGLTCEGGGDGGGNEGLSFDAAASPVSSHLTLVGVAVIQKSRKSKLWAGRPRKGVLLRCWGERALVQ